MSRSATTPSDEPSRRGGPASRAAFIALASCKYDLTRGTLVWTRSISVVEHPWRMQ